MKKITSIFSLALFSALTPSLSSCSDCDGGDGSGSEISADVLAKVSELEAKLAEQAQKIAALPSDGSGVITYKDGKWYYSTPGGALVEFTPSESLVTYDPATGHWFVNGKDTGVPAKGEKGDKGDQGEAAPAAQGCGGSIAAASGLMALIAGLGLAVISIKRNRKED